MVFPVDGCEIEFLGTKKGLVAVYRLTHAGLGNGALEKMIASKGISTDPCTEVSIEFLPALDIQFLASAFLCFHATRCVTRLL